MKGILGKKIGMTQIFDASGVLIPVTVIDVTENVVLQKKTVESDGYVATQLGFDNQFEQRANKAELGIAKKVNVAPKRFKKEILGEELTKFEVGQVVAAGDVFAEGETVDVQGISKGKGYQGVVKRWNAHIGPKGHGSGYHRQIGSMGSINPNRIKPGKHMAGRMGNETKTVQNLKVVKIIADKNVILVSGSVPGAKNSYVIVKSAAKVER